MQMKLPTAGYSAEVATSAMKAGSYGVSAKENEEGADCTMTLPFLTATLPGIGGQMRALPEDFQVEERPLYLPCGEG